MLFLVYASSYHARPGELSKTFFLYHVVKEKEKISGNHFVPSVGIFINLPDCACIKKLFSHPV